MSLRALITINFAATLFLVAIFCDPPVAFGATPTCTDSYGKNATVPAGFGAAYNLFSSGGEQLLNTKSCTDTAADITLGNGNVATYIYRLGYHWNGSSWQQVLLMGDKLVGSLWYSGTASATIPLLAGNTTKYYAGYACQQINSAWKCGCHDATCAVSTWGLQKIAKNIKGEATATPTATLTADPTSIRYRGRATLTWTSTSTVRCTGSSLSTSGQTSGSVTVTPTRSTTYTLSCTNGTSDVTKSVTVAVNYPGGGSPYSDGNTDSGPVTICGNNICEAGETSSSCSQDCRVMAPVCGNNMCESGETFSCSQDCVGAGANIVSNGGFDSGIATWTSSVPDEYSYDSTLSRTSGGGSLRLTTSDALATSRSAKFTLLPNRFYRVTAYVYGDVPAELRLQQYKTATTSTEPNYPAWVGVRGSEEGWQEISAVFLTALDVIQGQVYLLLRNNGTVAYDDISVELLPQETPFALGTGFGVNFLGRPSIMGMRIVGSQLGADGKTFSLDTNAAHFELNANTGVLSGRQTLGETRERVSVQLPVPTAPIRVVTQDEDRVILTTDKFDISFQSDSMVTMALATGTQATVTRPFVGEFSGYQTGYLTSIDDIGGVAVYPGYQRGTGLTNSFTVSEGSGTPPDALTYTFGQGGRLAIAVFPPRAFEWQKSFDDQIIHTDLYPSRAVLEDWSAIANVVILHENIWRGAAPKIYPDHVPVNDAEFRRAINDAHSLGMKIAPYFSSDFFSEQNGDAFIKEVKRLRDEYGFDSIYYDGINAYNWEYAYETMRRTRDLFPNGRVYLHISYGLPFRKGNINVFLPQLESLADYTLQGESVSMSGWNDPYLNYVARGYKVSNTIGTLKYDNLLINGQHPTLTQVLSGLLNLNMRQRIVAYPTSGGVYPTAASISSQWSNYFTQLANMKAQWEAGQLP